MLVSKRTMLFLGNYQGNIMFIPGIQQPAVHIAVLVATKNRNDLLRHRSLPSILNQSLVPDTVVLVEDDRFLRPSVSQLLFEELFPHGHYLTNQRTPGAAGAWNTGLDFLLRNASCDVHNVWVAILDDDDYWEPSHLSVCAGKISASQDMVVSGLIRVEDVDDDVVHQSIPARLTADALLVGNPHIQGSNLFVRLSSILQAGLFDEQLSSCTDRDLCLRLCNIDTQVVSTGIHTVRHYAEAGRPRLSSPASKEKHQGLERFYQKYGPLMNAAQQEAFLDRAYRLFDWRFENEGPISVQMPEREKLTPETIGFHLVLLSMYSANCPHRI